MPNLLLHTIKQYFKSEKALGTVDSYYKCTRAFGPRTFVSTNLLFLVLSP